METNLPDISYNKKRTYKSKRYTILIPDDAVLQTNVNGAGGANRDFTAFLSHNKNDSWESAPVSFSSAGDSHTSDGTALTAEQAYQYFETVLSRMAAMTGDETTMFRYSHGKIRGAICHQKISDDCSNFHIWAGEDGHMYQFRVIFNVEVPDKKMLDQVKGWLDTMEMTSASTESRRTNIQTDELKQRLMRFYERQGAKYFTILDICSNYEFSEYSNQKMSALHKQLEDEGFLIKKIEKKKSYFASKKAVMQEQISEAESELKSARDNLSRCQNKHDSIPSLVKNIQEMKAKNLSEINAAAQAVAAAKEEYDSCVERKNEAQRELESLGLFAFGKKKETKARIEQLDSEAAALNVAFVNAQSDLKKLEQCLKSNETSAQKNIDKIRADFTAAQNRVAQAEEKLEALKKELGQSEEETADSASSENEPSAVLEATEIEEEKSNDEAVDNTSSENDVANQLFGMLEDLKKDVEQLAAEIADDESINTEDKSMYERSNMFANIECKFKYADEETILDSIKESGSVILQSGLAEQTITGILIMCANYGLGGKGTLSNKQKKAVDVFLGIMFTGDINDLYDDMCQPLNESEIEAIAVLGQLPADTALAVLHYILAYAYIDGKLDDERAEFLDSTFGQALLMNFLQSGEEEVPGPFVQLSGLDADIAKYFEENDPLVTYEDVCEQFPNADRDAVKKSLDYLVEEEVLYIADTAVGKMYARMS